MTNRNINSSGKNLHIVSVSGGASSALTLIRVVDRYQKNTDQNIIVPIFADTNWEHPDLLRFVDDLERYTGIPIVRLNSGKTPADVSEEQHMIFNSRVAKCTQVLKTKPIEKYVKKLRATGEYSRVYMNIGFNTKDRYDKADTRKPYGRLPGPVTNWRRLGITVRYPPKWVPRVSDPKPILESMGFALPEPYLKAREGNAFVTNNCSGGCFKAGVKYWRGLLLTYPDTFIERMNWEDSMRSQEKYAKYAILTRTINGIKLPYPLTELYKDTIGLDPKALRHQMLEDDLDSDCVTECLVF